MLGYFDDIQVGQVVQTGSVELDDGLISGFCSTLAPSWDASSGAPEALVYAVWAKLEAEASAQWPQTKRLAVDALRWMRSPPVGDQLRGRVTVKGKDPVGENKGIVIAQHDLLDSEGRLVFSCLTRSVFARSPNA